MTVHIGSIIKEAVNKSGMSVTDFADQINYSRRNVYEIFEKETIDTGVLLKINKVLGQNLFFAYLDPSDLEKIQSDITTPDQLKQMIADLKVEVDRLKKL
jgi:plasmid maintenance system antidote protein VapI